MWNYIASLFFHLCTNIRSSNRRRNLWVGWCVYSWWPLFPSRSSVLIYIYIYAPLYEFCFLYFTNCVLLSDDNSLIPGCLWLLAFVLNFDTRYLVFYNSPPRMFLSLDLLSEYRIQHGAIGPLYVRCSYSTWISCRGVSGFATDCPCDVWCRGLTICLLHVGPPVGNRFLNTSRAVGLTYGKVYLHFYVFWHIQLYMSWYIISFFGFIFTSLICFIFLRTPVLTSSIDVVFALSIFQIFTYNYILNNLTKCKRDKRCIPVVVIHSLFSSPNFLFINISSTTFVDDPPVHRHGNELGWRMSEGTRESYSYIDLYQRNSWQQYNTERKWWQLLDPHFHISFKKYT